MATCRNHGCMSICMYDSLDVDSFSANSCATVVIVASECMEHCEQFSMKNNTVSICQFFENIRWRQIPARSSWISQTKRRCVCVTPGSQTTCAFYASGFCCTTEQQSVTSMLMFYFNGPCISRCLGNKTSSRNHNEVLIPKTRVIVQCHRKINSNTIYKQIYVCKTVAVLESDGGLSICLAQQCKNAVSMICETNPYQLLIAERLSKYKRAPLHRKGWFGEGHAQS